jgi:tetratricopeptide (TPR) repeat protein
MPNILFIAIVFLLILFIMAVFIAQQIYNVQKTNQGRRKKTLSEKISEGGLAPMETDRFREIVMSSGGPGANGIEPLTDGVAGAAAGEISETPDDTTLNQHLIATGHRINIENKDLQTIYSEYLTTKNINPFDLEPEFFLGVAYMKFAQYDKAQIQFRKIIDAKPEYPGIYYYMGESLRCNGQFYEAMIAYKKSWEMDQQIAGKTNETE